MIEVKLDANSGIAFERQIINQVKHALATGGLNVGEQLPAAESLADQLKLNVDIVRSAYRKLEAQKLVESQPGPGDSVLLFVGKSRASQFKERVALKLLCQAFGNKFAQQLLEKIVSTSQYLMGIGSGGCVLSSGERIIIDVLVHKCVPPFIIFDAGAYRGLFLELVLNNITTDDFQIHCFEPGSTTFQLLENNTRRDRRIKLNNLGLGKQTREMTLHYDVRGSGRASLTKMNLQHLSIEFDKSETVRIMTIDDYCSANSVERINLLKMDVEGHELDVLEGAAGLFKREAIDIVTFEFGRCDIETRSFFKDFYYFFRGVNMNLFRITPSEYLAPIRSYEEIHEQFRTTNFIAVKNE